MWGWHYPLTLVFSLTISLWEYWLTHTLKYLPNCTPTHATSIMMPIVITHCFLGHFQLLAGIDESWYVYGLLYTGKGLRNKPLSTCIALQHTCTCVHTYTHTFHTCTTTHMSGLRRVDSGNGSWVEFVHHLAQYHSIRHPLADIIRELHSHQIFYGLGNKMHSAAIMTTPTGWELN